MTVLVSDFELRGHVFLLYRWCKRPYIRSLEFFSPIFHCVLPCSCWCDYSFLFKYVNISRSVNCLYIDFRALCVYIITTIININDYLEITLTKVNIQIPLTVYSINHTMFQKEHYQRWFLWRPPKTIGTPCSTNLYRHSPLAN